MTDTTTFPETTMEVPELHRVINNDLYVALNKLGTKTIKKSALPKKFVLGETLEIQIGQNRETVYLRAEVTTVHWLSLTLTKVD